MVPGFTAVLTIATGSATPLYEINNTNGLTLSQEGLIPVKNFDRMGLESSEELQV
jgi:hypothetical protein